jgi:serine/threonine protein kinase
MSTYQESYEKLGSALAHMSDRLRELLAEGDDGSVGPDGYDQPTPPTPSWHSSTNGTVDTAAKLKDMLAALKKDKASGGLQMDEEAAAVFKEMTELLAIPVDGKAAAAAATKTLSAMSPSAGSRRTSLLLHEGSSNSAPKPVISARACVVCHRDDRPGEQRKSGFKCHECIGMPSHIENAPVTFAVLEKDATKSVDGRSGRKFIDDYDMGDNVGKGAYGKVKTCRHKKSGQMYAMKIVDRRKLERIRKPGSDKTEFDKVMMEIAIMKSLQHPNVVKMYEVIDDQESGKVYLIMEFCGGGRIFDLEGGQEGLAAEQPERLKKYIVAMANGLEYLHHQPIFHRDLKPDNILLDNGDHVKLTDFGVSSVAGEDGVLTQTEGTPAFNAPEEFEDNNMSVDGAKADIWSFGVTVYCVAFGHLPFTGHDIREIGEAIKTQRESYPDWADPLLVDLIKRILQKDPAKRCSLSQVLQHSYLEDVRTVKGQAVETITCRMKSVGADDIGFAVDKPEFEGLDGLFIKIPQRNQKFSKYSKGVEAMSEYINTKGGMYQVVLPTPDSCTMFRPRSSRRHASTASGTSNSRDMSFSFLSIDSGTRPAYARSPLLEGPLDPNRSRNVSPERDARDVREPFTDITINDGSTGDSLLDSLGLSFL